jgi:DNA-binding CsgD family transcriptional regulator
VRNDHDLQSPKVTATTTYRRGSNHDRLSSPAPRHGYRDPDHAGSAGYFRLEASEPAGACDTRIARRARGLRLAEAELAAGDRRAATRELSSAAAIAGQLDAAPLVALIADVARRGGIGAVPSPAFDGLTAREREILARVVAGASNRDIATALFISRKTVSVHVSAQLRKFGVSGRGDLSAAVQSGKPDQRSDRA